MKISLKPNNNITAKKSIAKYIKVNSNSWQNLNTNLNAKFKNMPCLQVNENPSIVFNNFSNCYAKCDYLDKDDNYHSNKIFNIDGKGNLFIPSNLKKIWNINIYRNDIFVCTFPVAENKGFKIYSTNSSYAVVSGVFWAYQNYYNGLNSLGFVKTTDDINIVFAYGKPANVQLLPYNKTVKSINNPINNGLNFNDALLDFNPIDDNQLGEELNPDIKLNHPRKWQNVEGSLFSINNNKFYFSGNIDSPNRESIGYLGVPCPKGWYRISFKVNCLTNAKANFATQWAGYHSYSSGLYTLEMYNSANVNYLFILVNKSAAFELWDLSVKPVYVSPQANPKNAQMFNKLAYVNNSYGFPQVFNHSITQTPYFSTSNPYLWHQKEFDYSYLSKHLTPSYKNCIVFQCFKNGFNNLTVYNKNISDAEHKQLISTFNTYTKNLLSKG